MTEKLNYWVVTDLDGTLMDENYDITPALETLEWLKQISIPVIPCTSKTAAEVRYFRNQIGLEDPYIVENGAAIYGQSLIDKAPWEIILGKSYNDLRVILSEISKKIDYPLVPLNDLAVNEIKSLTGLSPQEIERALDRHWSVPFLNPPSISSEVLKEIKDQFDVNIFQGNRMSHLLSKDSHKGLAVEKLKTFLDSKDVIIIALGDSQNDLPLLDIGDISIVVPSSNGANPSLQEGISKGKFMLANDIHAKGWSNSIRSIIEGKIIPNRN